MKNEENIGLNVRGKHAITSLLVTSKILICVNSPFIKEGEKAKAKEKKTNKF